MFLNKKYLKNKYNLSFYFQIYFVFAHESLIVVLKHVYKYLLSKYVCVCILGLSEVWKVFNNVHIIFISYHRVII